MKRKQALDYIGYIADDALSFRKPANLPCDTITDETWLIGWQCGFEPMFVAVKSYMSHNRLDEEEAVELAMDGLREFGWFGSNEREPDYVIR